MSKKVGIVVPTLGTRPRFLNSCLESIRAAGNAHICLVAPASFDGNELMKLGLVDQIEIDPTGGLAKAINHGISALPKEIEFINWLGDDDLLVPGSLIESERNLMSNPEVVMVFGSCDYIDSSDKLIFTNKSGKWVVPFLRFGPDLIPQPGSLFRRSAFAQAGGLDCDLKWAFDLDLFIKLRHFGKLKFLNKKLASFRWHPESLTVEFRVNSASEASQVRKRYLPRVLKPLAFVWEFPVKKLTIYAGSRVTKKAKKRANR